MSIILKESYTHHPHMPIILKGHMPIIQKSHMSIILKVLYVDHPKRVMSIILNEPCAHHPKRVMSIILKESYVHHPKRDIYAHHPKRVIYAHYPKRVTYTHHKVKSNQMKIYLLSEYRTMIYHYIMLYIWITNNISYKTILLTQVYNNNCWNK